MVQRTPTPAKQRLPQINITPSNHASRSATAAAKRRLRPSSLLPALPAPPQDVSVVSSSGKKEIKAAWLSEQPVMCLANYPQHTALLSGTMSGEIHVWYLKARVRAVLRSLRFFLSLSFTVFSWESLAKPFAQNQQALVKRDARPDERSTSLRKRLSPSRPRPRP